MPWQLFFVKYEVESLAAVELKAGVARDEGQLLGDGVGYDEVVGRAFVALTLVQFHLGVCQQMLLFDRENRDVVFVFNRFHHSFRRLPTFRPQPFVAIGHYHFLHRLRADAQHCVWFFNDCSHIVAQQIGLSNGID